MTFHVTSWLLGSVVSVQGQRHVWIRPALTSEVGRVAGGYAAARPVNIAAAASALSLEARPSQDGV